MRPSVVLSLILSIPFSAPPAAAQSSAPAAGDGETLRITRGLAVPPVGRTGRVPFPTDAIQHAIALGTWKAPSAGDTVTKPDGEKVAWREIAADAEGVFREREMRGGYLFTTIDSPTERPMLLHAIGHSAVYVNGEPRAGDPYANGLVVLPVKLRAGANELLFAAGRGTLRASLAPPRAPLTLDLRDATFPDLVRGCEPRGWCALQVVNATGDTATRLRLRVGDPQGAWRDTQLPPLPPFSMHKLGFELHGQELASGDSWETRVELRRDDDSLDATPLKLRVVGPRDVRKITFRSSIEGGVQYCALLPATPSGEAPPAPPEFSPSHHAADGGQNRLNLGAITYDLSVTVAGGDGWTSVQSRHPPTALVLSLHGAGVEASGQAASYSAKSWCHILAPTNRRPFGFDWEDWGRLDALEVLNLARDIAPHDPARVYLTGHSMGGHGTWHLGATFPDRFAAIGPSAGWLDFWSYSSGPRAQPTTDIERILDRAANGSDTKTLLGNAATQGICILHGDADDNVPVTQARTARELLAALGREVLWHEQPGAGHWWDASDEPGASCVDWPPMFDLFARRRIPPAGEVRQIDFTTMNPGVSARCYWARVDQQLRSLAPSRIELRLDPGARRISGKTENVSRLTLTVGGLVQPDSPVRLELDDTKLEAPWPAAGALHLARSGEAARPAELTWQLAELVPAAEKNPARAGPFKDAFRNNVLFVYGTAGTPEETALNYAKARFDAETFWYRGNGGVVVVADRDASLAVEPDRNVVLYGNADNHASWRSLLGESPIQVRRGGVTLGERRFEGDDLGALFIRPRPDSDTACVAAIAASGPAGARALERLPVFLSGVAYPDFVVLRADALLKGAQGVEAAGFFGNDWGVELGSSALRLPIR